MVPEKDAHALAESARLKVVTEELAASRVEVANSRWGARNIAEGSSNVEDDVGKALMAVSREVSNAIKRMFCIIGLKQKHVLKRVPIQV